MREALFRCCWCAIDQRRSRNILQLFEGRIYFNVTRTANVLCKKMIRHGDLSLQRWLFISWSARKSSPILCILSKVFLMNKTNWIEFVLCFFYHHKREYRMADVGWKQKTFSSRETNTCIFSLPLSDLML